MNIDNIAKAIENDAGIQLPDLKQSLAEMQQGIAARSYTSEQLLLRSVRKKTGLSQQAFAQHINTPVTTLRDWEQGRFKPSGGILCLFKVLQNHPEIINELTTS
ncbi:MAG: helix-turn-helix domain-containing protein [Methylococcaceae bacterium]|nr:helix-turn-helix domain-containing protein [Methylococcaceae bacterium]